MEFESLVLLWGDGLLDILLFGTHETSTVMEDLQSEVKKVLFPQYVYDVFQPYHYVLDDPNIHASFLDLVDRCIREFQNITDSKLVALSLTNVAKTHFSKNNSSLGLLLNLYALAFVIEDVDSYKEWDKSVDAESNSIQVLTQLENHLRKIKSNDEVTKWHESYCAATIYLCEKLSLLIKSKYKEIIDHGLKNDFDPIDLPVIVETLCSDISNSQWETNKNDVKRATNASQACFILSLITKQKTKCLTTFEVLINGPFQEEVHKCLFSNLADVSKALFKANRKDEAEVSLKLFCQAAWDRVIQLCKMFQSRKGDVLEGSINSFVTKASVDSASYINIVKKDNRKRMHRMVDHFIDRWSEANNCFPILSPIALVSQWVKIQCKEREVPEEAPLLYTILPCLQNKKETLVIILDQELQCYQDKKMNDLNKKLCAFMQNAIKDVIEKIPDRIKYSKKRYTDLIKDGTQLRYLGVEGVKDYIEYISQAIVILTDLSKKNEVVHHHIPDAYCLRALCTREANPKSKDFMNDIKYALNIWLSEKQPIFGDFGLLLYVLDLLSLEGYTDHQSSMCMIIVKFLKSQGYSPDKWVEFFGKYRCLGDHAICASPIDDTLIMKLVECSKEFDDVSFWIKNSKSKAVKAGFKLSLCVSSTFSSPDSCNNDEGSQSDITSEVKKAVSNLIKNDTSTETKSKTNTFLAAQLYFDLAERMTQRGMLTEALTYAKECLDWRLQHYESCFTINIKKKSFAVNPNIATPACFFNIVSDTELIPTPWRALQCTLESYLQVGCIYSLLGDGIEAKTHLLYGRHLSDILNLTIYSVRFDCEIGDLLRNQCNWIKAETALQRAKRGFKDIGSNNFCKKCKTVLEVLLYLQLGNLYVDMFNSNIDYGERIADVVVFCRDAEKLLQDTEWENDVSSPTEESERTTSFCDMIEKGSTNCKCQKKCWHCQPNIVADLLSLSVEMKWECIRRRLWIRVLTMKGIYHGASGDTENELNTLFKSISVVVSRSTYRGSNFRVSPDFLKCMIDKNWTGDACSIEHASVLYHICCCFLKCMDKNDTSNNTKKISTIVLGLKLSYLLGREVPALCQKVSQLLSVLYTLSISNKSFMLSPTSLSARYAAAFFHQASIGTHFNHKFVSRVKRLEDEFTESNPNINDSSMLKLPSSTYHCLWLPPKQVKDLENFIVQFFEGLPAITIVCINFLDDGIEKLLGDFLPNSNTKSWSILSRIDSSNIPVSIIHPIQKIIQKSAPDPIINKESTENPWVCNWRGTIIDRIAPEFESIHETAHAIWKTGTTAGDRRRKALDKRLSKFISRIESEWIGPWKNMLLGERSNDMGFKLEVEKVKTALKANFNLDIEENILKLVMECACEEENIKFVVEALLINECYINDHQESPLTWIYDRIRETYKNMKKECSREPVILVIGYALQIIPWENMEILKKEEVYRMPSIISIVSTLSMCSYYERRDFKLTDVFPEIDPSNAYYLMNVDGDLNFGMDESWFKNLKMKGVTKKKPSVDDLISALTKHDLYIYLSHGSGEQFIAANSVQNLHKCAGALLMGCSSGRLTLCGSMAPTGAPIHYLLGGSPFICCNLWTMADNELGQFSRELVHDLIDASTMKGVDQRLHNTNDQERPSKKRKFDAPLNIGSFLIKCREKCYFRYLSGASTVCFGVPTSIHSKEFEDGHNI